MSECKPKPFTKELAEQMKVASHQNIINVQEKYSQYKKQDASQLRIKLVKNLLKIQ